MTKHNLEKSLNDWAMINQQDGERVGAKTMLQSVGRIRVNLEKFSTWLLASAGSCSGINYF